MHRKFIYFINPISGTKNKSARIAIIKKRTAEHQIPFEIFDTSATGDYTYLPDKISTEKITDVIICGGDGTINQIVKHLLDVSVRIGIIPMGSGNGLALAAKIPKKINAALDIVFNGKSNWVDAFFINHKFSCMLCGLGFDAQVAHDFARQKKRGLSNYIKQTVKNFAKAKPFPFALVAENVDFTTEAFFISIANSNQFGNHFTIAPQASLSDGWLDIVVVNKMNKIQLLWKIIAHITNGKVNLQKNKRSKIHYFQTQKITIHNPQRAPLHIDGDPAVTDVYFEISVIEKAFQLMQPVN